MSDNGVVGAVLSLQGEDAFDDSCFCDNASAKSHVLARVIWARASLFFSFLAVSGDVGSWGVLAAGGSGASGGGVVGVGSGRAG